MERLNALDWVDGLSFVAYGVRIGVRVTRPGVIPKLLGHLPPASRTSSTRKVQWLYSLITVPSRRRPTRLIHTLYSGPDHLTQGSDFLRIRRILAADLQTQLALTSPWRTFVHAGAVGWEGKAIVMPGENGAGKSTLTAGLVRAGASLFSDEFAVLDRRGRVHPYPLPLRLRPSGGGPGREVQVEELGGRVAEKPLPVGMILSVRYDASGPGRLLRLSPGRGAMELLAHATQARIRPNRVLESVGRAAEGAVVLKGRRGEADAMVREALTLLGEEVED